MFMASKENRRRARSAGRRRHPSLLIVATLAVVAMAVAAAASATDTTAKATTVNVVAGKPSEFKFTLSTKTVKKGTVTFKLTNTGNLPHDLKICSSPTGGANNSCTGQTTPQISKGGSATLKLTFTKAGTYEYLCTVPGHAAAGMKGDLTVT
jgi:uncharacterized cupredoxin-like copper-binding protein